MQLNKWDSSQLSAVLRQFAASSATSFKETHDTITQNCVRINIAKLIIGFNSAILHVINIDYKCHMHMLAKINSLFDLAQR